MNRPGRVVVALLASALLVAGGWCWWAAREWRASVPWPARATPGSPGFEPLGAAHTGATRWPVRREAVERLARLYLANGFTAEAASLLPGIISRRPDAPEWMHRHAVLLAEAGRLEEAVVLWQKLRSSHRDHAPVRVKLADALAKLDREDEAAQVYRELLADDPGNPYAWYGLVRLDVRHQRWTAAREKLGRALAADPDFYGHHALLATVARQLGDEAQAAASDRHVKRLGRFRDVPDAWMEPAVEDCFDPYLLRVDADRIRSDAERAGGTGGLGAALARLDRAIALEPANALNYQLLATIHGVAGDEAAAERAYVKGLELDPRSVTLYQRYANLLGRRGREEALRALLDRATTQCPADADLANRHADANVRAALALLRKGDEAGGLALLRENLRRHPQHETTLGYLVLDAIRRGDVAEARQLLLRLDEVAPGEPATGRLHEMVQVRFGIQP